MNVLSQSKSTHLEIPKKNTIKSVQIEKRGRLKHQNNLFFLFLYFIITTINFFHFKPFDKEFDPHTNRNFFILRYFLSLGLFRTVPYLCGSTLRWCRCRFGYHRHQELALLDHNMYYGNGFQGNLHCDPA